jgi:hypothetical protein
MIRPRAADDFAVIRARLEELRWERALRCRRNRTSGQPARGLIPLRVATKTRRDAPSPSRNPANPPKLTRRELDGTRRFFST